MSIETDLHDIAVSLAALVNHITKQPAAVQTPAPAPVEALAVPAFAAPASSPAVPVPFNDEKSLMAYCMSKYKELGPVKGGLIQQVLTDLGVSHLSALTADKYEAFFKKVETL